MSTRSELRGRDPVRPADPDLQDGEDKCGLTIREEFALTILAAMFGVDNCLRPALEQGSRIFVRRAVAIADELLDELMPSNEIQDNAAVASREPMIDLAAEYDEEGIRKAFDDTRKDGV